MESARSKCLSSPLPAWLFAFLACCPEAWAQGATQQAAGGFQVAPAEEKAGRPEASEVTGPGRPTDKLNAAAEPVPLEPIPDPAFAPLRAIDPPGNHLRASDHGAREMWGSGSGGTRSEWLPPNARPLAEIKATAPAHARSLQDPATSDIVAQAMTLPDGSSLAGHPMTLLDSLSAAGDSSRRLQITHAYWNLAGQLAEYRCRWDEWVWLETLVSQPTDGFALEASQTAAAAQLQQAHVSAASAQHRLARALMLPPEAPLPLPADRPHAGPYRTFFEEIFLGRVAPAEVRTLHEILPLREREIRFRARAVQAAWKAAQATEEAYRRGAASLAGLLADIARWTQQRRELVATVNQYNGQIADYAFAVVTPDATSEVLVRMLIKQSPDLPQAAAATFGGLRSDVRSASLDTPIRSESQNPLRWAEEGRLTADRLESGRPATSGVPTLAPPREAVDPEPTAKPVATPPQSDREDPTNQTLAPGESPKPFNEQAGPEPMLVPVAAGPESRRVGRPALGP